MAHCKVNQLDMHGFCNRFDSICIKKNCRFFGVKTNADRIRAMSDEELANWMAECNAYGERAEASQWLPWLQQPVREE